MTPEETRHNCVTPLDVGDGLARLERLSRKGRLAGFRRVDGSTCEASVFGSLYDRVMTVSLTPAEGGTRVAMSTRLKPLTPAVVVVVMVFTLFPGVVVTHSMLETYFGGYPGALWVTCAWYLPLTLLAVPALLKQFRTSEAAAKEHALETAQKIARALETELES